MKSEKSIIVKSKTERPSKELVKREAKSAKDAKPEKAKPAKVAKSEKVAKAKKAAPVKEKKATTSVSDDLKQLSGVGPALEKKLHAAG